MKKNHSKWWRKKICITWVVPPGNAYVEIASNPSDEACDWTALTLKSIKTRYGFWSPMIEWKRTKVIFI